MNKSLIKRAALSNKYYAEEIEGGYIIPCNLIKEDGTYINLSDNRKEAIVKNQSSFSINFEKDIKKLEKDLQGDTSYLLYIKEFPIPLDKGLWREIIKEEGLCEAIKPDLWNKNYLLLDYLFYKSGFIVEIDSNYHDDKLIDDKIRDRYVYMKHGLDTVRYYEYGKSSSKNYYRSLKREFNKRIIPLYQLGIYNKAWIDFSDIITDNFIIQNSKPLEFIQKLFMYTKREYKRGIVVTLRDIYNIDPYNFGIFSTQDQVNLFLDNIEINLKYVFGKTFIVHRSMQYTVEEVMWAVENKNNPNIWDILRGNSIPRWIVSLIGLPRQSDRVNLGNIQDVEDDEVIKLVKNLKFYEYF